MFKIRSAAAPHTHLKADKVSNISDIYRNVRYICMQRVPLTLLDSMVGPECEAEGQEWSAWSRRVHTLIASHAHTHGEHTLPEPFHMVDSGPVYLKFSPLSAFIPKTARNTD